MQIWSKKYNTGFLTIMDLGYDIYGRHVRKYLSILRRDSIINITRMALSSKYVKLKKDISTTICIHPKLDMFYQDALYILCAP